MRDTDLAVAFDFDERVWREAAAAYAVYASARRGAGGGEPKRLLVDIIVGTHALLAADRLMTLDTSRYERAFPDLTSITA